MPVGQWLDYAVKHIPNLVMVYRETPLKIFNKTIGFPQHKSDVVRLESILTFGTLFFIVITMLTEYGLISLYFEGSS